MAPFGRHSGDPDLPAAVFRRREDLSRRRACRLAAINYRDPVHEDEVHALGILLRLEHFRRLPDARRIEHHEIGSATRPDQATIQQSETARCR